MTSTTATHGRILVLDVGTSRLRASIVLDSGAIDHVVEAPFLLNRPYAGAVEFDPSELATSTLELTERALAAHGPVDGIGISVQRASTVIWEQKTGTPVAPGIGWQDLRTTGRCLALQAQGIRVSPNQTATKIAHILDGVRGLNQHELCAGTLDSYLAYVLSNGEYHVTDRTNAGVTGLMDLGANDWDESICAALSIDQSLLPRLVPTSSVIGPAHAVSGAPLIAALCGDQQASLVGQGCLVPGSTKATFGTGAMVDCCVGVDRPAFDRRGNNGTFPIVAWEDDKSRHWGVEAVMLSAGTCVEWLCNGLGLIDTPRDSAALAASVADTGGVVFVPSLGGMGTPMWDFGARGALVGLSASTTKAEIVRAVLEGIAMRGCDLVEAIEADCGTSIATLHVDGGMTTNSTFVELLAGAVGRPVALSAVIEATTRGAGYLAGVAVGIWPSLEVASRTATPREVVEPKRRPSRERWLDLRDRALRTVPALSAITF